MFLVVTLQDVLLFFTLTIGLGAALAPTSAEPPVVRLLSGVTLAIAAGFAIGFICFACGQTNGTAAMATASFAIGALAWRWQQGRALLRDSEVRKCLLGWVLFAGWTVGLLSLVVSYSGGGWAVDWLEHWQRTEFFLHRQPLDTRFAVIYSLTARPPLANLLVAVWLRLAGGSFAEFQLFIALFGSLVVLPVWTLARHWRGNPAWVVPVLMMSPLVAQNLTFSWTKLPAAFFVLTALAFFATCLDASRPLASRVLMSLSLGLGLLVHYSTAVWILALAAAASFLYFRARPRSKLQSVGVSVLAGAVLPALWIGWACLTYGLRETLAGNTSAAGFRAQSPVERITVPLHNLYDTVVPFLLRGEPADGLILQFSQLGRMRDIAFMLYQTNLPISFGLAGLSVLGFVALRQTAGNATTCIGGSRAAWWILVVVSGILGVVAHTPRDEWGLVHICLQPLVLLGLAYGAAHLENLSRFQRMTWGTLAGIDVLLGIVLHFAIQSAALAHQIAPASPASFLNQLTRYAAANANDKAAFHLSFFADRLGAPPAVALFWLVGCLVLAIGIAARSRSRAVISSN